MDTVAGFIRIMCVTRSGCRSAYSSARTAPQGCPSNVTDLVDRVLAHPVDIADVGRKRDIVRLRSIRRFPTPTLVVVDEPEPIRKSIQLGQ